MNLSVLFGHLIINYSTSSEWTIWGVFCNKQKDGTLCYGCLNFFWKLHLDHGLVLDKFMSSIQPRGGFRLFVYTFKPLDVRGTAARKTNRTMFRLSEAIDLCNRFTDKVVLLVEYRFWCSGGFKLFSWRLDNQRYKGK